MTSNNQLPFLVRAPANGAPVARGGSRPTGGRAPRRGSTPIGDRAQPQFSRDFLAGRRVTGTGKSVTHVLNQKCYLCFDGTPDQTCQMKHARCSMLNEPSTKDPSFRVTIDFPSIFLGSRSSSKPQKSCRIVKLVSRPTQFNPKIFVST